MDFRIDPILPRVCELARFCPDRQTKIAACELLHSCVLYMLYLSQRSDKMRIKRNQVDALLSNQNQPDKSKIISAFGAPSMYSNSFEVSDHDIGLESSKMAANDHQSTVRRSSRSSASSSKSDNNAFLQTLRDDSERKFEHIIREEVDTKL